MFTSLYYPNSLSPKISEREKTNKDKWVFLYATPKKENLIENLK